MKNQGNEKLVTESVFKKFTEFTFKKSINRLDAKIDGIANRLNSKIDGVEKRLDAKIDAVALSLLKTQEKVDRIKKTMATKEDINTILHRIDSYVGKNKGIDQEQSVQGLHIKELRETSLQHERRITALEAPGQRDPKINLKH